MSSEAGARAVSKQDAGSQLFRMNQSRGVYPCG
jgi:hypothetical protein